MRENAAALPGTPGTRDLWSYAGCRSPSEVRMAPGGLESQPRTIAAQRFSHRGCTRPHSGLECVCDAQGSRGIHGFSLDPAAV